MFEKSGWQSVAEKNEVSMRLVPFLVLAAFLSGASIAAEGLTNSSELGIAVAGGNSDSQSFNAKESTAYGFSPADLLKNSAHYLLGKSGGLKSAENWHIDLRYERVLNERFTLFAGPGVEGDKFAGFENRIYADLGGKYFVFPDDQKKNYLFTEAGYRYVYENRVPGAILASASSHIARLYIEGSHAIREGIWGRAYFEFLPDLSDTANLIYKFEPSLNVTLSGNLALKLAFQGTYRARPLVVGNKKFDYLYTTSLVANF